MSSNCPSFRSFVLMLASRTGGQVNDQRGEGDAKPHLLNTVFWHSGRHCRPSNWSSETLEQFSGWAAGRAKRTALPKIGAHVLAQPGSAPLLVGTVEGLTLIPR